ILQLLRHKVLVGERPGGGKIRDYSGRGSLLSWLRVVATRIAVDVGRDAERETDAKWQSQLLEGALPDEELRLIQERHRPELERVLAAAVGALSERERLLLKLSAIDGLTVREIGALLKVDHTTVSRWLAKARGAVVKTTHHLLAQALEAEPAEVESLIRLLKS